MTRRILYVSPFSPDRAASASEVRSLQVAQALSAVGRVQVVVVEANGPDGDGTRTRHTDFDVPFTVHAQPALNSRITQKIDWLTNARSAFPHGIAIDEDGVQRVLETAAGADLVWFFKLRTANMFSQWAWPRSVVDIDDVPSKFEHSTLAEQRFTERLLTSARMWSWRRRERLLGERFTVTAVCSESDKLYLRSLGLKAPIHVIPNGYERPKSPPSRRIARPPRIGFIGVFDHGPNLAGIHWFARNCWPLIKRELPDARLRLVGRQSDGPLTPGGADIDALGWMADPADEIATWSLTVVPVHTGAGTRGKIAHAFSQQCPVVSTTLGAYGYDAIDGDTMFLADSAEDFARACIRAIGQPTSAAAMANRAWKQFLDKWTWDVIRRNVWAAAEAGLHSK